MKRIISVFVILVSLVLFSGFTAMLAGAGDVSSQAGEVLYHQDFADISDFSVSGILQGTLGSKTAVFDCSEDSLRIETKDNERVYLILPHTDVNDSYTVEFDFEFDEASSDNGYISYILTCRGSEPTNISSLTIRAGGSVDDFKPLDEALAGKISSGERITCRIPIENGVLHVVEFITSDGSKYSVERNSVLVTAEGERGFIVRNATVSVSEIFIVGGTDYTEKSGYYAENSYAGDTPDGNAKPDAQETSPKTGDYKNAFPCILAAAAGIMMVAACSAKRAA